MEVQDGLGCLLLCILGPFILAALGIAIYEVSHCKDSIQLVEKYTQTACSRNAKGTIVNINDKNYLQCECPDENK